MIGFRAATANDRDAILDLRRVAFPSDDPEKQSPEFWQWEFAAGYAGPARVFVAESDDRIVGHFAFVPQTYFADAPIRGALAVDVMTHPDYRRQKVFSRLAQFAAGRVRDEFQLVIAFRIRDAVRGGMEAGGWREVDDVPVLLKPVSFRRAAQDFLRVRRLGAAFDLERRRSAAALQVDHLLENSSCRQPRSAEFLRWRYLENPHWRYTIDGDDKAFVIYRDTILRGMRTMAIADLGGDEESLRALLRRASDDCHQRGIGLAAAMISRAHPAYRMLRRAGFFPGPHKFRLLLQTFDPRVDARPWSLSWGDTDHL